jgi:hypothetical protein
MVSIKSDDLEQFFYYSSWIAEDAYRKIDTDQFGMFIEKN